MWFFIFFLLGISPRLILFIIWFCEDDYVEKAFDDGFLSFLGWLFMPWTTLWLAYVANNGTFTSFPVWRVLVLVLCILSDCDGDLVDKQGPIEAPTSTPTAPYYY